MTIDFPCGCEAKEDEASGEYVLVAMCNSHRAEALGCPWEEE